MNFDVTKKRGVSRKDRLIRSATVFRKFTFLTIPVFGEGNPSCI
jgi:hypothetical protein